MFVQRAGRAARAPGRTGLAVLLVEKSAYGKVVGVADPETEPNTKGHKRGSTKKAPVNAKGGGKGYSVQHGVNRGAYGGAEDEVKLQEQPTLDLEAEDEGMSVFVQTGTCRREVLREVFGNEKPSEHHISIQVDFGINRTTSACRRLL